MTRESSGEGEAGGGFRMLEVSGGYAGIKERFSKLEGLTVVLECIIHLDFSSRIDKVPLMASERSLLLV